jgi:DNA modification methylase
MSDVSSVGILKPESATSLGLGIADLNSARSTVMAQATAEGLEITMRPVQALRPRPGNPRIHSRAQVRQIAKSIEEFGFNNPVLIDKECLIVAGHGRVEAARLLGMTKVPTIRLDHMSESQLRAFVIADNRLAERSGWDKELLAKEFEFLTVADLQFDITTTGFGTGEIDLLLEQPEAPTADDAEGAPAPGAVESAVTRLGDLWRVGDHRIFCGDATDAVSFAKLLGRKRAQMVFVDPPYNVAIDGHVCGAGAIRHREFQMASGEMNPEQFTSFLADVLGLLMRVCQDGAILFTCMDWRHAWELTSAARNVGADLKNVVVWRKDNAGMGSLYRSQHELIFVLKNGQRSHINNVELGRFGRYRTNVWEYPGANSLRKNRRKDLEMHPTVKPVALVADAIRDCSNRGGIVLDCFAGSGTTLIAAHKSGRRGYLMEIDPVYVDVAIRRFEKLTGIEAVLEETEQGFSAVAQAREVTLRPKRRRGARAGRINR